MSAESIIKGSGPCQFEFEPIEDRTFGAKIRFDPSRPLSDVIDALCQQPTELLDAFNSAGGLIVITDMHDISYGAAYPGCFL